MRGEDLVEVRDNYMMKEGSKDLLFFFCYGDVSCSRDIEPVDSSLIERCWCSYGILGIYFARVTCSSALNTLPILVVRQYLFYPRSH